MENRARVGTHAATSEERGVRSEERNSALRRIGLAVFVAASIAAMPVYSADKKRGARKSPPGKVERIDCMVGTDERQARIAIEIVGGQVQSFAYYGKTKPRTCSMDVKREDAYSAWEDHGATTTVTLVDETGAFLINNGRGRYHFIFRDIDRMRYCGMDGKMNGSLTVVRKGRNQHDCSVERIIIEGSDQQQQ